MEDPEDADIEDAGGASAAPRGVSRRDHRDRAAPAPTRRRPHPTASTLTGVDVDGTPTQADLLTCGRSWCAVQQARTMTTSGDASCVLDSCGANFFFCRRAPDGSRGRARLETPTSGATRGVASGATALSVRAFHGTPRDPATPTGGGGSRVERPATGRLTAPGQTRVPRRGLACVGPHPTHSPHPRQPVR